MCVFWGGRRCMGEEGRSKAKSETPGVKCDESGHFLTEIDLTSHGVLRALSVATPNNPLLSPTSHTPHHSPGEPCPASAAP